MSRSAPGSTGIRVRVRLFAIQRELAGTREVALDLAAGARVEDAWTALVAQVPSLAPGRPSVRFAVNGDYADADATLADGDELACIPPVSGGAGDVTAAHQRGADSEVADPDAVDARIVILEIRGEPFGPEILVELSDRLATDGDGAVVGFLGRTRSSPGTPAPGQEAEARRHAGRAVEALEYEAHESMAIRTLERIAAEVESRFGVRRLAIVHRTGEVPLGEVSVAVVAVSSHRDAAFACGEVRHRRDEGPRPDLEGRAFRRRPRLDRSACSKRATALAS